MLDPPPAHVAYLLVPIYISLLLLQVSDDIVAPLDSVNTVVLDKFSLTLVPEKFRLPVSIKILEQFKFTISLFPGIFKFRIP